MAPTGTGPSYLSSPPRTARRPAALTSDRIRSNFDYQELSDVFNDRFPNQQSYHFAFPLRKIRHIFYHRSGIPTRLQIRQSIFEYILHGEGHVAATEMVSDFIDLGAMKSVRKLSWDADLPRRHADRNSLADRQYF